MNFDLSEDQHEIRRTARELLAARARWEDVRAASTGGGEDAALWSELCALGWPGIAVAEEHGGAGLGVVELAVVAEELGFACAPVPFLGSALAATLVEHAGSAVQRERWLGGLIDGSRPGAVAVVADGAEAVVPGATAEALVVIAGPGGGALLHSPGTATAPVDAIDPTRAHGLVVAGRVSGEPLEGDVATALDRAAIVVAAELVGVCRRALEMTVAYVKERHQFGGTDAP